MEKLLLTNNDITTNTPLGGNVDVDKYRLCIADAQISKIEEILGSELYEKIKADFPTFVGVYSTLYDYVKPLLIHQSALEYILIGAYSITNAGIFKLAPTNATPVEKNEVDFIANNQRNKAEIYAQRLERWLCKNSHSLPEYRCSSTNNVNPNRHGGGEFYF